MFVVVSSVRDIRVREIRVRMPRLGVCAFELLVFGGSMLMELSLA